MLLSYVPSCVPSVSWHSYKALNRQYCHRDMILTGNSKVSTYLNATLIKLNWGIRTCRRRFSIPATFTREKLINSDWDPSKGDLRKNYTAFVALPKKPQRQQNYCSGCWNFPVIRLFRNFSEQNGMTHWQSISSKKIACDEHRHTACILPIKTIPTQTLIIMSYRILSNTLCFYALFIHTYISAKAASI